MKKRVLSAIIMIVVLLPLLIIGNLPFAILVSILGIGAVYELLKVRESAKKIPSVLKIMAYVVTAAFCLYSTDSIEFTTTFDYRVMSVLIFLFLLPLVFINDSKKYNIDDALFILGSVLFIGLTFNLIITIRNYDLNYIIYLLLITILTDTFALLTGMLIGEHKLASKISPKKTVEGLIGGAIMGTFVATCFYHTVISASVPLVFLILITLGLSLAGQMGDLVFSAIKRHYDVKDFSELIPGHGGILDRCDSLIFVVLAFILVMGII